EVLHDVLQHEFAALAISLCADATISQGGCRITSAGAVIDAELESRWRRAIAKLGLQVQWDD
ncbi:MAG: FliH/SctL family protein, partial [Burkholderiaceae bacterium]